MGLNGFKNVTQSVTKKIDPHGLIADKPVDLPPQEPAPRPLEFYMRNSGGLYDLNEPGVVQTTLVVRR